MTTNNGEGSMGEPSFRNANNSEGFDIRVYHQICIPSNGPVSDGKEETLARQVLPLFLFHTTLTRSTDVKIIPDTYMLRVYCNTQPAGKK